jgi:hypothetical protein
MSTKERRLALFAFVVAPLATAWSLALFAPASSRWSLADRIGACAMITGLWIVFVWVRNME